MDILSKHEVFEIQILENLKNNQFLEPLVFGGGTMLRLCYELNRYSADLDFWFIKKADIKPYFHKLKDFLGKSYELTDACIKYYTLLFEIRSARSPKKLKIEIRKKMIQADYHEKIAFSPHSTKQVILKVFTLEQMMKNKIEAALDRKDIRDCFDIEFLLRHGVSFQSPPVKLTSLKKVINSFNDNNFKVTLGAVLGPKERQYYIKNGFDYLLRKIDIS